MQTLSRPMRRNRRGYALIIIMSSLAVMLLIFAGVMYWVTSSAYVTAMNNQFNMSEAAAEAATEKVLSQMNFDYVAQTLSNSATYYCTGFIPDQATNQASWPVKYVYSDTNGVVNQISVYRSLWTTNTVPLNSQYVGLYGLVQDCLISATATPIGQRFNVPATVSEGIQFASIPLFQFAIFYNMDLEIAAAQPLSIVGPVWSNGGLWSGSTCITFANMVSAVGLATNSANDPFCTGYTGSGKSTYSMAGQPTSGNDRITMPIGTNNDPAAVHAIIDIPPNTYAMNTAAAYTTNGQLYLANAADLYLTNLPCGTNWGSLRPNCTNTLYFQSNACTILFYQDANNNGNYTTSSSSFWTQMPYDFYLLKTNVGGPANYFTNYVVTNGAYGSSNIAHFNCISNVQYAGYSFVTNDIFYDWREGWNGGSGIGGKGKAVQAIQIDIALFNIWLTNTAASNNGSYYNSQCRLSTHKSHPIDSIYVYNAVPLTSTTLPAVRVANGAMLPSQTAPYGLTVATAQSIYVLGNYNTAQDSLHSSAGQNSTAYTWPAGLMGDSITILSGSWNDGTTSKKPVAADTTVNAAMLSGIVRSTNALYSGGVENFLRTLESWGSTGDLWYNGSIVVMFPSQYATNYWRQTGNYYDAPTRHWAFDTNFIQQGGLPPLTPQAKGVIRANWFAY